MGYNTNFDIEVIIMDNNKTVVEDNAMDLFMAGHFLQWLRAFPEAPAQLTFADLTNGVFLHNILQNFDAAFTTPKTVHPHPKNFHDRVTNIEALVKNLKSYYEVSLGHNRLDHYSQSCKIRNVFF